VCVLGHAELVLDETALAVEAVPIAYAVERVKERGQFLGLVLLELGAERNQSSLNARTLSALSSPLGASKGTKSLVGFGALSVTWSRSLAVAWLALVRMARPMWAPRVMQSTQATEYL